MTTNQIEELRLQAEYAGRFAKGLVYSGWPDYAKKAAKRAAHWAFLYIKATRT